MHLTLGVLLATAVAVLGAPSTLQAGTRADTCGKVQNSGSRNNAQRFVDRIVGGSEAQPYSWPWQVGLRLNHWSLNAPTFFCGGSIIDKKWVVTAGHCCDVPEQNGGSTMDVFVGTHRKGNILSSDVYPVRRFIKHWGYSLNPAIINDICAIELSREITFGLRTQPVCIAQTQWATGTECYASGWGSINFAPMTAIQPDALQQTSVNLVSESSCRQSYAAIPNIDVGSHTLCAVKPGTGPCRGDSGGPLVCRRDDRWELVGVTSAVSSVGCGHPLFPTVFANAVHFRAWLTSTTGIQF